MTIAFPFEFSQGSLPLLVSIPHAGTRLTHEVVNGLSDAALPLSDTDWHIPRLYDFVKQMGASVVKGNYSRLVIDLNRPADDTPLYTTATTGLYPETLFDGSPCFKPAQVPTPAQREHYLQQIWLPYHQQLQQELLRLKQQYGYALLFDAHSIASQIPRLFEGRLPDLNLGTNSGASCCQQMMDNIEQQCLQSPPYSYIINGRFKGGYITRAYGQPDRHIHALQLELAQCNYMDECVPFPYHPERAAKLQLLLRSILETMLKWGKMHYSC
jgi:N-formylglutamate deformylase